MRLMRNSQHVRLAGVDALAGDNERAVFGYASARAPRGLGIAVRAQHRDLASGKAVERGKARQMRREPALAPRRKIRRKPLQDSVANLVNRGDGPRRKEQ